MTIGMRKHYNRPMTIWSPRLAQSSEPLYLRIADQLEQDIEAGVLLPGSRLPTQRELARKLGVTVVTVTRAYAEAAQRGLVESTVGRGSFVRMRAIPARLAAVEIDLSTNVIHGGDLTMSAALAARIGVALTTQYGVGGGSERHRAAGLSWVLNRRTDARLANVVVTAGAQQALFVSLAALCEPGDVVLTEELTYHWARATSELLRVRLEGVAIDRHGMLPDALAKAARQRRAKVVYVTPTLHNPTGIVMPEKRRRDLAAVAEQLGLTVIEDDVYGFLAPTAPLALTAAIPDRGIFLTGLGKSVAPALRVGYLLAPPALHARIEAALNGNTLFTSPIGAEIAASAIEDGSASRVAEAKRHALLQRARIARRVLNATGSSDERSPHLWIPLPRRWTSETFAAAARARGVRVATSAQFAMTKEIPNAIRVSIGAPPSAGELESALRVVEALHSGEAETAEMAAAV
jgi:DNA-binding transcriptional MocR family regulator